MSISSPESSARQIFLVFFEKYLDFMIEFSVNVSPSSLGLLSLNSDVEYVLMYFGNKSLNFLIFSLVVSAYKQF
jgi:hypothetical protein